MLNKALLLLACGSNGSGTDENDNLLSRFEVTPAGTSSLSEAYNITDELNMITVLEGSDINTLGCSANSKITSYVRTYAPITVDSVPKYVTTVSYGKVIEGVLLAKNETTGVESYGVCVTGRADGAFSGMIVGTHELWFGYASYDEAKVLDSLLSGDTSATLQDFFGYPPIMPENNGQTMTIAIYKVD